MLHDTKPAAASGTIWGGVAATVSGLVAVVAALANLSGYEVSEADVAALTVALTGIVSTIGGVMAILGRVRATKRIGRSGAP